MDNTYLHMPTREVICTMAKVKPKDFNKELYLMMCKGGRDSKLARNYTSGEAGINRAQIKSDSEDLIIRIKEFSDNYKIVRRMSVYGKDCTDYVKNCLFGVAGIRFALGEIIADHFNLLFDNPFETINYYSFNKGDLQKSDNLTIVMKQILKAQKMFMALESSREVSKIDEEIDKIREKRLEEVVRSLSS